jgi:TusA-related sulfurtransferase
MFKNIHQYFSENILTEYYKYAKLRKNNKSGFSEDLKQGLKCASSMFDFREQFSDELNLSRKQIESICPNFKLLADVVNVSKHGTIDRNSPKITNSKNIFEEIVCTKYVDKKGDFQHIQVEVIIELDSGENIVLYELLTEILNMWIEQLNSIGLFLDLPLFSIYPKSLPRRNKNSDLLKITSTKNFYGRRFRIQRYNYELGRIEPEDITNSQISMKLYVPTYYAEVSIDQNNSNEIIKIKVDLTESEKNKIESIVNKDKQIEELLKIAKEKGLVSY